MVKALHVALPAFRSSFSLIGTDTTAFTMAFAPLLPGFLLQQMKKREVLLLLAFLLPLLVVHLFPRPHLDTVDSILLLLHRSRLLKTLLALSTASAAAAASNVFFVCVF